MTPSNHSNRIAAFFNDLPPRSSELRKPLQPPKARRGNAASALPAPPRTDGDEYPPYLCAVPFADRPDSRHWVDSASTFLLNATRLLARFGAGERPDWPAKDVNRVAGFVNTYVGGVAISVVFTPEDIPHRDQNEFEREEWRLLRAQWAKLRPARKTWSQPNSLTALLAGQSDARPAEIRAIIAVFNEFARRTRAWLRNLREYQERMNAGRWGR